MGIKIKGILINLGISILSIIFVLIIGEIILRIYYPRGNNKGELYRKEDISNYDKSVFIPNTEVIHYGIPTKINSAGLKNREITLQKPEGVIRIEFFGDSFTYGQGLPVSDTLPSIVESNLNQRFNNRVETLNFGVCGMNTFQEIKYAINYGLKFSPDIVILVWIYNDIDKNGYTLKDLLDFAKELSNRDMIKTELSLKGLKERVPNYRYKPPNKILTFFAGNSLLFKFFGNRIRAIKEVFFRQMIEYKYSDENSEGFLLSMESIRLLDEVLRQRGIEFFVVLYPKLDFLYDEYLNEVIYKKVERYLKYNGITYYNMFELFRNSKLKDPLCISEFDCHPTRYANEIAAEGISMFLIERSRVLQIISER